MAKDMRRLPLAACQPVLNTWVAPMILRSTCLLLGWRGPQDRRCCHRQQKKFTWRQGWQLNRCYLTQARNRSHWMLNFVKKSTISKVSVTAFVKSRIDCGRLSSSTQGLQPLGLESLPIRSMPPHHFFSQNPEPYALDPYSLSPNSCPLTPVPSHMFKSRVSD